MGEHRCAIPPSSSIAPICAETARATKPVERFTVQHHALPALVGQVRKPHYSFCDVPTCEVACIHDEGRVSCSE